MNMLNQYGYPAQGLPSAQMPDGATAPHLQLEPARIIRVNRSGYELITAAGHVRGILKRSRFPDPSGHHREVPGGPVFPVIGDFVLVSCRPDEPAVIYSVLPRASAFSRIDPEPGAGAQVLAANIDLVLILSSMNRDFNPRRLERYCAGAWESGAVPLVVLTKADLASDPQDFITEAISVCPGADVLGISSRTGQGMDRLNEKLLPGKTSVLLGSSGVGKSSLVNALSGEEKLKVSGIREIDGKGRHTTTHRQMILLQSGHILIDTPGMREMGLWDSQSGIETAFPEIDALEGSCRFSDCSHGTEPGCAIRTALETGTISPDRWNQYLKLRKEAAYNSDPERYKRQQEQFWKKIARSNR